MMAVPPTGAVISLQSQRLPNHPMEKYNFPNQNRTKNLESGPAGDSAFSLHGTSVGVCIRPLLLVDSLAKVHTKCIQIM